ncbi:efflux RND transporter periplasmic adaptor subunit [Marinimicrobium agarilyticum]|uniref:efflux RND transporter periplasmic adaptor subunit n=1 Tax=Marinimicrobium agarilyticum TaxID=306546 RepID=UPI0003FC83DD|nr:efflux RND transporter periplasmic adaptor subunit [Marinimicrobium agarilyticum]
MKASYGVQRVPLVLVIIAIGVVGVAALLMLKPRPTPHPEVDPPEPVVQIVRVNLEDRALTVETQGTVAPRRNIQLISQVGGQIVEAAPEFVAGGRFDQGDWLVRLDRRDYQNALARAESQLRDAERVLAEERGRARQAEREWRDLGNQQANELFLRRPQIAAAEAAVEAARAERNQARLDLERTEIRAPFSGRIRQTQADLGQFISPGSAIAEIYDDAVAQVRLPLMDDQAALLDLPLGTAIEPSERPAVTFSGRVLGERHQWQGAVVRTEASLDAQSRMLHAIAEVPEPFNTERHPAPLLMGLFVQADIDGRELDDITSLPITAVFERDRIYTVKETEAESGEAGGEKIVQEKRVRVLKVDGDRIWVKGPLTEGEAVIVDRQGYVSPGVAVRFPEEEASSSEASSVEGKTEHAADAEETPETPTEPGGADA